MRSPSRCTREEWSARASASLAHRELLYYSMTLRTIMETFKIYLAAAASALLLVACSKEAGNIAPEPVETVTLTINAGVDDDTDGSDSKTYISGNGVLWSTSGEKIKIFEKADNDFTSFDSQEGVTTDGGNTMTFGSNVQVKSAASFSYSALYPASCVNLAAGFNNALATLPQNQKPTATSFSPKCDILIAKKIERSTQPTSLDMRFARVVAVAKMGIKNLDSDDKIVSINFTAKKDNQDVVLAGLTGYDLNTSTPRISFGAAGPYKSIKLDYSDQSIDANGMTAWFTCYPFELYEGDYFTVVIETETATFTRDVFIPAGRSLKFISGKPTIFNVNMLGVVGIPKQTNLNYACLNASEWVSAGASSSYSTVRVKKPDLEVWKVAYAKTSNSSPAGIELRRSNYSGGPSYIMTPYFNQRINKIRVKVSGTSGSGGNLFFTSSASGTSGPAYASLNGAGIYELDLSSALSNVGYIRATGTDPYIEKVEIVTKNDQRPALATPQDVQARLKLYSENKISVFWSTVADAAGYYVTITPASGTPITQYVSGKNSADFENLPYETSYIPSVIAVPANLYTTAESASGTGSAISTLADPNAPSNWRRISLNNARENDIVVIVCANRTGDFALPNDNTDIGFIEPVSVVIRNEQLKGNVPDNLKWKVYDEYGDYGFYQYGSNINRLYCTVRNEVGVGTNINQCYEFFEPEYGRLYNLGQRTYLGLHGSFYWTALDQNDDELDDQEIMIFKYMP